MEIDPYSQTVNRPFYLYGGHIELIRFKAMLDTSIEFSSEEHKIKIDVDK